jgi:8-oxo-dGTP pyrophosphatase MutT (NUDIX family)
MKHFPLAITTPLEVVVIPTQRTLAPDLTREIDARWEKAVTASGSRLFNGKLLNFVRFEEGQEKNRLVCEFVDYKQFFVQCLAPVMSDLIQIVGVGVRGITIANGKVLVGRRSAEIMIYGNMYEFAPAGSLDTTEYVDGKVDYAAHLLNELQEETGYEPHLVEKIVPFGLVWNNDKPVIDICSFLSLGMEKEPPPLLTRQERGPEYSELLWVPFAQIDQFIEQHGKEVVPTMATTARLAWEQRHCLKEKP